MKGRLGPKRSLYLVHKINYLFSTKTSFWPVLKLDWIMQTIPGSLPWIVYHLFSFYIPPLLLLYIHRCLSVCLSPINDKTAEPIESKFFCRTSHEWDYVRNIKIGGKNSWKIVFFKAPIQMKNPTKFKNGLKWSIFRATVKS